MFVYRHHSFYLYVWKLSLAVLFKQKCDKIETKIPENCCKWLYVGVCWSFEYNETMSIVCIAAKIDGNWNVNVYDPKFSHIYWKPFYFVRFLLWFTWIYLDDRSWFEIIQVWAKLWNNLPSQMECAASLNDFKVLVKQWTGPSCRCRSCDIDQLWAALRYAC